MNLYKVIYLKLGQRFIDLINYVELHSSLCLKKNENLDFILRKRD